MKRAAFLTVSLAAGGAAAFGFRLDAAASDATFAPSAFLTIDPAGECLITIPMSDIGQGVATALAMALADELDADWANVRVNVANANAELYGDQGIGGSRTMRKNTKTFRQAGAAARAMLVAAAARSWNVEAAACRTEKGTVYLPGANERAAYGSLLASALNEPAPANPTLKNPVDFLYMGKPTNMLGSRAKCNGSAAYSIDLRRDGMLYASLVRAPRVGSDVVTFDESAALRVPGVRHVVAIDKPPTPDAYPFWPSVAVLADSYWAALKGREAAKVVWSAGPHATVSSKDIRTSLLGGVRGEAFAGKELGDVAAAFTTAARRIEATYETPLQAHATLEPQNALADVRRDRCEIWAPTQSPGSIQSSAAKITGLAKEQIIVHQALPGGGFGRRSDNDYVAEAVVLSHRIGRPVKVVWTREDDMRHDVYRPPHVGHCRAALDANGELAGLVHRHAGPTIGIARGYAKPDEADLEALEGMIDIPYAIAAYRAEFKPVLDVPLHFGWWRAVSVGQNVFASECFLDEIAGTAGVDPFEYRMRLLKNNPRAVAVLDRAATRAGWSSPVRTGTGRGIALGMYGKTLCAQVAFVRLRHDGSVKVDRIVCAMDCGAIVNPRTVEAQIEGGIAWALGATLKHEITVKDGAVVQGNFDSYPMLRIRDMPAVDIELIQSQDDPSGVGESAVPPLAPAVCNALFALTGKRIRRLPVRLQSQSNAS